MSTLILPHDTSTKTSGEIMIPGFVDNKITTPPLIVPTMFEPHKISLTEPVSKINTVAVGDSSPAAAAAVNGIVPEDAAQTDTTAAAEPLDPRPRIETPGPGRSVSAVAMELGQVLAPCGIYRYCGKAAVYDEKIQTLDPIKPAKFRTWIEKSVVTFKAKADGEVEQSMTSGDAGAVLISDQFLDQLREV